MKLTTLEKSLIGKEVKTGAVTFVDEEYIPTIKEVAESYGIRCESVYQYRKRHPESRDWPVERVCEMVVRNKDQSAVAKRQGFVTGPDGRKYFGKMPAD